MKKQINLLAFFAIFTIVLAYLSCSKQETTNTKSATRPDILPSNTKEKPLSSFTSSQQKGQTQSGSVLSPSTQSSTSYGCGSSPSGNYNGTGLYTYPTSTIDLTSTSYAATISITVHSYDVPNRFDIYDASGAFITTSSWMGYATYSGPWGSSLNTPETQTLTFSKKNTTYTLRVQTSTSSNSDAWDASISCPSGVDINSLTNQQIIDIYTNVGAVHNEALSYVLSGLKSYYGQVYTGSNSKAAHDLMRQKIDGYLENYLTTKRSVSQNDADSCVKNFKEPINALSYNLSTDIAYSPYYSSMSTAFKNAVAQLNTITQDSTKCYTKSNYDAVYNNNISLISSNAEKVNLVSMCSTGYNSMIYWRDSGYKWQQFFGNTTALTSNDKSSSSSLISENSGKSNISNVKDGYQSMKASTGRAIGVADMEGITYGAVGGCAWGAAGGTIVLPGAGTVAGCAGVGAVMAIGGGLEESARSAITSFYNWLTS